MANRTKMERGGPAPTRAVSKPWNVEVSELLAHAAELSAGNAVELDQFIRGAYAAYFQARPGMREELAERALNEQIDELRRTGRIAVA